MGARALGLLLLLALLWSSAFTLTKVAVGSIPPTTVVVLRMVLASLLLWLYLRFTGRVIFSPETQWGLHTLLAVTGNVLPFMLIGWAQIRVDSGLSAILIGTMPLITLALAPLFLRDEHIGPARIGGFVLGFAGIIVLFSPRLVNGFGGDLLAYVALLGGATSFAVNMLLTRRIKGDVVVAATSVSVISAVIAMPLCLVLEAPWTITPTTESLLAVVALGVTATALATIVFFQLVRMAGATSSAMVNYLIPGLSVLWGVLFLGESPGWPEMAALVLIVGALILVNRGGKPQSSPRTSRIP
jgi:drug/metabolite transporter (DMT)-like permease